MSDDTVQDPRAGAGGRAAKAREELAAVPSQDLLGAPGRLLQYLLDNMLAGHEQDDDVTVLVMHVPASADVDGVESADLRRDLW